MSHEWDWSRSVSHHVSLERTRRNIACCMLQVNAGGLSARWTLLMGMDCNGRRRKRPLDYRQLADIWLPRATRRSHHKTTSDLFPVTIRERNDTGRVKVHYVGYSSSYDDWKDGGELEILEAEPHYVPFTPFQPFSLYKDLCLQIKLAMSCSRKACLSV